MSYLFLLRWHISQLKLVAIMSAGLVAAALGLGRIIAPDLTPLLGGLAALLSALTMGLRASEADRESLDFVQCRGLIRAPSICMMLGAVLLAHSVVLLPIVLAREPQWAALGLLSASVLAWTGVFARQMGQRWLAVPSALMLVAVACLHSRHADLDSEAILAVVMLLGFVTWFLVILCNCRSMSPWPMFAPLALLTAFGLARHVAITPAEAAAKYVRLTYLSTDGGTGLLGMFKRDAALRGLRSIRPVGPEQQRRHLEGLIRLGAAEAAPLLLKRWRERVGAPLHSVDALAMRWWIRPADLSKADRELLFTWAARRAARISPRQGLREMQALIYLTGRLDPRRAARIWMPHLISRADPAAMLAIFSPHAHAPTTDARERAFLPVSLAELYAEEIPAALLDLAHAEEWTVPAEPNAVHGKRGSFAQSPFRAMEGVASICLHVRDPRCDELITTSIAYWPRLPPDALMAFRKGRWRRAIALRLERDDDAEIAAGALVWAAWHGDLALARRLAQSEQALDRARHSLELHGWVTDPTARSEIADALGMRRDPSAEHDGALISTEAPWTRGTLQLARADEPAAHDALIERLNGKAGYTHLGIRYAPSAILRTARALEIVTGEWHGADATAWRAALARRFGD